MSSNVAEYVTVSFEDGYYNYSNITVYDDDIKTYDQVVKVEVDILQEDETATNEIHVYKLYKIIKPQRTIINIEVVDPYESASLVPEEDTVDI